MPVPHLPLVVTADPDLLDDLLRLAAAGGTEVVVAADPAAARSRYSSAPLVVIGADQAVACSAARLPRRSRVVVVGSRSWPPDVPDAILQLRPVEACMLPDGEPWLVDRFAEDQGRPLGRILAVIGGSGGAGASILAGGLAITSVSSGHRTLLVDADPLGGGLDLLLGWERIDGLRWPALTGAGGRVDPPSLLRALPHRGDLVLLSFARDESPVVPGEAMAATLDAGRRGRDVIITDLPRQLDDASVLALQSADRAVLIVPAELRATAGAARIAQTIRFHRDELSVVVRGPAPGRLKARDIAAALHLPLAGSLRPEPAMCQAMERGAPPAATGKGPLAELCRRLLRDLFSESPATA
ncbi:septum site-determining protein Ssd [Actinoplanes sp. NPDC026619]|uniref:septum site-determining protein Ssd n=1 Tax=Actinoplanes sp. NPDC026619 TaxID=3155798 RepID=UPI0033CA76A5